MSKIKAGEYKGRMDLEYFEIPSDVTEIGDEAFAGCKNLKYILYDSQTRLNKIGKNAFAGCRLEDKLEIPKGVNTVGSCAFMNCTKLEGVSFMAPGVSFGDDVFSGCTSLKSVDFPNFASEVSTGLFSGCVNLEKVSGMAHVTNIFGGAFEGCKKLDINLPRDLKYVGDRAFSGCQSMREIVIGGSVSEIGEKAFENCTGVTNIEIKSNRLFGNGHNGIKRDSFIRAGRTGSTEVRLDCLRDFLEAKDILKILQALMDQIEGHDAPVKI